MQKLTPTQEHALQQIRSKGVVHSGNGISVATVRVLRRLGLVTVEGGVETWTNYLTKRFHSQCYWTARPVKED